MRTVYKPAYGFWLVGPAIAVVAGVGILVMIANLWLGILILLFSGTYIGYVYSNSCYIIDNDALYISCGRLYNKKIDIAEIRKIEELFSLLSQPAFTYNRLDILYKKFETIQISPKEQEKFVNQLTAMNPAIVFAPKKK